MSTFPDSHIRELVTGYVTCALWSSTDGDGTPLDDMLAYGRDKLAPSAFQQMQSEVVKFAQANKDRVNEFCERFDNAGHEMSMSQVGHDLWLTRNRHGAGFWDRGVGKVGDDLTEAAHSLGESDLYVGDDGSIYVTPSQSNEGANE